MDRFNVSSSTSSHQKRQHPEKIHQKLQEIISTAPKNGEWATCRDLYQYQGFWYYKRPLEGTLLAQKHFKANPSDIILCTSLESGTSILKTLVLAILNRSNPQESGDESETHSKVPFLEDLFNKDSIRNPKACVFATHIPYTSLPKSIIDSKCKIVYMCRNPKDVLVELWHSLGTSDPDLGKVYGLFCKGVSIQGPFWDHVLGYWEATMKYPERVLFLTYEKLESETSFNVRRLAQFMGCSFSLDEERHGVVQKISANVTRVYHMNEKCKDQTVCLTKEMKDHINHITTERFKGSGLMFG